MLSGRMIISALAVFASGCAPVERSPGTEPSRAAVDPPTAGRRPNILLILVDDLKPALRSFGDQTAFSPNIDRLAARGMRFDLAYANQAVCAPSRINLMTGARSTSTGIYDFGMNLRDYLPNAVTLPQFFKAAGYHAESMGKVFHIGHNTTGDAASWSVRPFKERVIEYVARENKVPGGTREEALFNEVDVPPGDVFRYARTLPRGAAWEKPDVPDEAYADGRVAARAVARLRALGASPRPFFLAVGFARPHLPFSVPKRYWDLYDPARLPMPRFERPPLNQPAFAGKEGGEIVAYRPIPEKLPAAAYTDALKRSLVHGYYAGVSFVDAQVGKVLAELDRSGSARNTIVVLWGDHGFQLGDHGIWTKHTNMEQATRIPLIFAGPGVRAGHTTGQLAETVDIYPTLAAMAGLGRPRGPQPIDGISMAPVLTNPALRLRQYAYHAYNRPDRIGQAIRTERYRLVRWTHESTGERAYELYDLRDDPLETRNIGAKRVGVRRQLDAILDGQPKPVTVNLKARRASAAQPVTG